MSWRTLSPVLHKLRTGRVFTGAKQAQDVFLDGSGFRAAFSSHLQGPRKFSTYREPTASLTGLRHSAFGVSAFGCNIMPTASYATQQQQQDANRGLSTQDEDPFDPLTDRIPERPVTVAEGASYGLIILAGLAVAAGAAYAVFKELIFEPKEYKIFGKALDRVQHDSQVTVRLGTPITGYGQESRNRAARKRISNRVWKDEDGVERVEIVFFIRGPQGSGKVYTEMFKDKLDRTWKFTYLIVDVLSPTPTRLMLESYVPA